MLKDGELLGNSCPGVLKHTREAVALGLRAALSWVMGGGVAFRVGVVHVL
jgi:hypothetical protein